MELLSPVLSPSPKTPKRKRNATFRMDEEQILVSLVTKYKNIVENKKTDAVTNKDKLKAWEKIAREYASLTGDMKESMCLRTKFNNMKKVSKKKFALEKKIVKKTGGGPKIEVHISETESQIRDMLGETLTGFTSEFDNDQEKENTNPVVFEYELSEDDNIGAEKIYVELDSDQAVSESANFGSSLKGLESSSLKDQDNLEVHGEDWTDYTPLKINTPKSEKLRVKQSDSVKTLQNKICTWAISKNEIAALQKAAFSEEHQLKLEQLREKHNQYMKIQAEEWSLKKNI